MSNDTYHSDPIMRLTAQRAARAAADRHEMPDDHPGESRSVTMIIYAWAAVGLVAFGVATTSLVRQSTDPTQSYATAASSVPETSVVGPEEFASIDEVDLITTSSINVEPTIPSIVNIYPRSHTQEQTTSTHGAQIGAASDVDGLVMTFTALEKRSPELLKNLNPLVRFDDRGAQVAANLITGPFRTQEASAAFCDAVKAQALLPCTASAYEGDPLLGE